MDKHRWVKEPRCFDCGTARPVAETFRCRIGLHAYLAVGNEGALTNRFYD